MIQPAETQRRRGRARTRGGFRPAAGGRLRGESGTGSAPGGGCRGVGAAHERTPPAARNADRRCSGLARALRPHCRRSPLPASRTLIDLRTDAEIRRLRPPLWSRPRGSTTGGCRSPAKRIWTSPAHGRWTHCSTSGVDTRSRSPARVAIGSGRSSRCGPSGSMAPTRPPPSSSDSRRPDEARTVGAPVPRVAAGSASDTSDAGDCRAACPAADGAAKPPKKPN